MTKKEMAKEIKQWEEQSLEKLEEASLNILRIKELENWVRILEEQVTSKKDMLIKIKDLEHDLKEEKFCYKIASARAKKYKAQLTIIKEAITL